MAFKSLAGIRTVLRETSKLTAARGCCVEDGRRPGRRGERVGERLGSSQGALQLMIKECGVLVCRGEVFSTYTVQKALCLSSIQGLRQGNIEVKVVFELRRHQGWGTGLSVVVTGPD